MKPPVKVKKDYHLYLSKDNVLYACTLNQTDLFRTVSKFHIMKLLKHNKLDNYCFLSRGGRVGYQGQWNCELFIKLEGRALSDWEARFMKKQEIFGLIAILFSSEWQI